MVRVPIVLKKEKVLFVIISVHRNLIQRPTIGKRWKKNLGKVTNQKKEIKKRKRKIK